MFQHYPITYYIECMSIFLYLIVVYLHAPDSAFGCCVSWIQGVSALSSMKPVPSVLLIIAAVLLSTHIPPTICRPRDLSLFDRHDDYKNRLDEVLFRAGNGEAVSILRGGNSREHALRRASGSPAFPSPNKLEELVGFTKRNDDPPISIDLTFHLLRNMIEMARIENQREQAELNRKFLDEVGK